MVKFKNIFEQIYGSYIGIRTQLVGLNCPMVSRPIVEFRQDRTGHNKNRKYENVYVQTEERNTVAGPGISCPADKGLHQSQ